MSRIANMPIPVPSGVKIELKGSHVKVTGPKGSLERVIRDDVRIEEADGVLKVSAADSGRRTVAFAGMTRSLVNNMVVGVDKGFRRKLVIEGVGYRAQAQGSTLTLNVGYSNPVEFAVPDGVSVKVDKNEIILESIDKELLGQTAARIRQIRKPEPYKGKGIRYEDEHIVRKAGKAAAK